MSKHTPGPWVLDGQRTGGIARHIPRSTMYDDVATAYSNTDAARIVECVNALDGVENPAEFVRIAKELIADIKALEIK